MGGVTNVVQVAETYTYGGRDGRVSKRDTAVTTNGAPRESFTQSFDYTHIGLANSLAYPVCTNSDCTQAASAVFADVPVGHSDQREIEAIYPNVTGGCGTNPLIYCPTTR